MQGGLAGLFFGLGCTSWLYRGSSDFRAQRLSTSIVNRLEVSTSGCISNSEVNATQVPLLNSTTNFSTSAWASTETLNHTLTTAAASASIPSIADFYSVSYLYYGCIGFALTLGMGIAVGLLTCKFAWFQGHE